MIRYKNQARKQTSNRVKRVAALEKLDSRQLFAADLAIVDFADLSYGPQLPPVYGPVQVRSVAAESVQLNPRMQVAEVDEFFAPMGRLNGEGEGDDHSNFRNSTATDIRLNSAGNALLSGRIEIAGDRDVFELDLTSTRMVTFKVNATSTTLDTYLRVYNSSGQMVTFDDDSGEGTNSLSTVSLAAGKYYVEVSGFNDRSIGTYNLEVQAAPSDDHSNALNASATNIQLSGSGRGFAYGNLESNSDVDVFRFDIASSRLVTIEVGQNGSPALDTYLRLYNSSGQLVSFDDDNGIGSNSRLSVSLEAGRYYIQVTSDNSLTRGGYSVSVVTGAPSNGGGNQGNFETLQFSSSGRVFESDSTTNSVKQYKMTAPATRSYRLQIQGLSLRSGTVEIRNSRGDFVSGGSFSSPYTSNIWFNMVAGQDYLMTIRHSSGSNGSFSFTIQ